MSDDAIQALIDRNDIIDLFSRYATGVDQRDRALYRSCFTDRLEWDMMGQGVQSGDADTWVDTAFRALTDFHTTQHIITNHTIQIDGDQASGVAYLQAQHWKPDSVVLVGGYYSNHFTRSADGWKIDHLELAITWS